MQPFCGTTRVMFHSRHCMPLLFSSLLLLNVYFFFNLSAVNLQCCVSFKCTAKWFNYAYICLYAITIFKYAPTKSLVLVKFYLAQWLEPVLHTTLWMCLYLDSEIQCFCYPSRILTVRISDQLAIYVLMQCTDKHLGRTGPRTEPRSVFLE